MSFDCPLHLSQTVARLLGKPCWCALVGGQVTGTHFSMGFGAKRPRRTPANNPNLSADENLYEGELVLYARCLWRLDSAAAVVCSARPGDDVTRLRELRERVVTSATVFPPSWDMRIEFSGPFVLTLYASEVSPSDDYNWHIEDASGLVFAGPGHTWGIE